MDEKRIGPLVIADNPDTRLATIIDSTSAFTGRVDSHTNTDVRGLLTPPSDLAGVELAPSQLCAGHPFELSWRGPSPPTK